MNNLLIMIVKSAMLFTGCENEPAPAPDNNEIETPPLKIEDYYPFTENTKYIYEGEGNEFASMTTYIDYIKDNRIQTRTDNGGTEMVKVMEIEDGQLVQLLNRGETYFRENFTDDEYEEGEVLLKEPIEEGSSWKNGDNSTSTITNTAKEVVTLMCNYEAIEVTTENPQGKRVDYYAKDMGLIKTVNTGEGYEVSSTLSSIEKDQPFIQTITLYYPDVDGITINTVEVQKSFNSNHNPKEYN